MKYLLSISLPKPLVHFLFSFGVILFFSACSGDRGNRLTADPENAGLNLHEGFKAFVVADSIGPARHLAVNTNGDIFVNLKQPKNEYGLVMLTDEDGDDRTEQQTGFGDFPGTGMDILDGYLYASSNSAVFRFALDENQRVTDPNSPETVINGLIDRRSHNSKAFTFDGEGNIYVNIGAFSNACQEKDRTKDSPGMMPCPILDSAGGIWKFKADALNQTYGDGVRYATGLRNVVGLDWNHADNALYVTQHGRDLLNGLFPDLYSTEQSAILPAEAMYKLSEGDDCGWPYIYYDQLQKKKILSPEYGGDGKKEGGENAIDPIFSFPGHMAPNDLLFYTGDMFPERYKNGAFVALHGSWNRAPEPQAGYLVAFLPFQDGVPAEDWEVFADGFAGIEEIASPGDAERRPCGLAQGPDGSLYVSDDVKGTIYRIFYEGK